MIKYGTGADQVVSFYFISLRPSSGRPQLLNRDLGCGDTVWEAAHEGRVLGLGEFGAVIHNILNHSQHIGFVK